jgi:hypothetical protein
MTEGPAMKSGLSTFSFYFIDLYKNAFYLESAMEALVGRDVEIPRSVFSADIARWTSLEPPEGRSSWKGTITELEVKQFTVSLEVLDRKITINKHVTILHPPSSQFFYDRCESRLWERSTTSHQSSPPTS